MQSANLAMKFSTGAQTPLLPVQRNASSAATRKKFCITSKPACFILLWNFAVLLVYKGLYDTTIYMQVNGVISNIANYIAAISLIAIFSTFAGVLTDVKFSRHKAVLCSSYGVLIGVTLIGTNGAALTLLYRIFQSTTRNPIVLSLTLLDILLFVTLLVPVMMYLVNALQFGIDQLHDSPTEDVIEFIHWYVWLYYIAVSLGYIAWNFTFDIITNIATVEFLEYFLWSYWLLLSSPCLLLQFV